MRLQLQILRHSLPPVHIIHTTGTGPTSHTRSRDSTIADLLQDVNDLVPLESYDGEWGLEDYVVEVAATADQETAYECLHFQTCEAVLRDDDEVLIRGLSTEDLRIRRLGGRHQITGDGRHLVDGVTFGKQWLRKTGRPGITIPPRKRRRLEIEDAEAEAHDGAELPCLLPPGPSSSNGVTLWQDVDAEDDEDDEDFVDDGDDGDDDKENNSQIAIREEFDDADVESEDESEALEDELDESENLPDEVRLLLEDAAEIEKATDVPSQVQLAISQLKRKRAEDDEGDQSEHDSFEGFSTPAKHPVDLYSTGYNKDDDTSGSGSGEDADGLLEETVIREAGKQARNILPDEDDVDDSDSDASSASSSSESSESDIDNTPNKNSHSKIRQPRTQISSRKGVNAELTDDTSSSGSSSESESDGDSLMANIQIEQARKRALNLVKLPGEDLSSESGSSSEGGGEESASTSGGSSSLDSDSSSASSESDSEDSSESELEEEEQRKVAKKTNVLVPKSSFSTPPNPLKGSTAKLKSPGSAPGEGSPRTHANNNRTKRRKRLISLQNQGLLPETADFKALAEYEERENNNSANNPFITPGAGTEEVKAQNLETTTRDEDMEVDETIPLSQSDQASDRVAADIATLPSATLESSKDAALQGSEDPSPRRAKLDLASSRRMLFSALGVRTPKDKAAEEALRVKLSNSIQPLKRVKASEPLLPSNVEATEEAIAQDLNFWKDKLIVSAVECERDGVKLPPPPFPFQQGWAKSVLGGKNRDKRRARDEHQYYHSSTDGVAFAEEISTLNYHEPAPVEADQVAPTDPKGSSSNGEISVPADLDTLQDLEREHLLESAIIAYKELQMDHTTNYQPEVSGYKVGKIESVGSDGSIQLILAKQFWSQPSAILDEETGERILGKFILQPDDAKDIPDDGIRDLDFSNMIAPKLVKASLVEAQNSSHLHGLRGRHGEDASQSSKDEPFDVVPESAEASANSTMQKKSALLHEQVEVATPRRDEITTIIKEAGFDSALDDQLLHPIPNPSDNDYQKDDKSEPPSESQGVVPHRFRHLSPRIQQSETQDMTSEIGPNAEVSALTPGNNKSFPSELDQASSSSPYMHTQETVEYPHISQIEINSSEQVNDANSSSHQDAQRTSPAPLVEMSFTTSDPEKASSQPESSGNNHEQDDEIGDLCHDSHHPPLLSSEVPQPLPDDVQSENDRPQEPAQLDSFLGGLGYGGQDSSYHNDEHSDGDSDGLPSVWELTSSQPQKSRKSSVLVEFPIKKSPPPARESSRSLSFKRRSTPSNSPDFPDSSSQPAIKLSQSQNLASLSQIPVGSQLVDLTFSSEVSSPTREDQDDSRANSKTQVNGKNKQNSEVAKRGPGIGNRRLLTKRRSYI
ncbi:uncharacterized protein A1O9_07081 [Exophiala aquamarina CBS 119918]|uniref:Uncharacterized protein n=1 Tax=Exophiala aquamarina CBS 119918 TaxID=1182545 RepID=A0A072PAJ1_9EURO|nr:uncharacterized protein A1O9_07081 [Exophiala aquamarina CBS 119918]KEF56891.1 hypothetical protein A1O9_07081 [Exophiala aquamarina CBS 119918]